MELKANVILSLIAYIWHLHNLIKYGLNFENIGFLPPVVSSGYGERSARPGQISSRNM